MKKNIRHFFILTALAAGTIHFVNRFIDMTAEMKNILKSQNGDYYDWKNGKIFYTKRGSGSPILLVHELNPISSSYEWCRLVKKLEKTHTVYTLDLLGCGRSDKPYLTYTNYLYVQLLTDFIHDVIGESPDVITTNNSVSFAVLAQNMDRSLIRRIIAINPPALGTFERNPDKYSSLKKTLLELPILGTFIYNVRTHETNIQKILRETYFAKPQLVSSKMLDAYYESAHMDKSHGKYLMASIEGHYTDNAIAHALKKIEIPLYIIESRTMKDAVAIADSYAHKNSCVETAYISNAGLVPQLEVPDKLLSIINMFLNDK
ncbi:MAG: alpha/beta fold hydrolase [Roseburia sp.]|nr:alpha/beta fold hydrolase [Roseburia sp.]